MEIKKLLNVLVSSLVAFTLCIFPTNAMQNDPDMDGIPGTNGKDYIIVHTEKIDLEQYQNKEMDDRIEHCQDIQ